MKRCMILLVTLFVCKVKTDTTVIPTDKGITSASETVQTELNTAPEVVSITMTTSNIPMTQDAATQPKPVIGEVTKQIEITEASTISEVPKPRAEETLKPELVEVSESTVSETPKSVEVSESTVSETPKSVEVSEPTVSETPKSTPETLEIQTPDVSTSTLATSEVVRSEIPTTSLTELETTSKIPELTSKIVETMVPITTQPSTLEDAEAQGNSKSESDASTATAPNNIENTEPKSTAESELKVTTQEITTTSKPQQDVPVMSSSDESGVSVIDDTTTEKESPEDNTEKTVDEITDNILKETPKNITICPENCEDDVPVCGSDQNVYKSKCHLQKETCGKGITVADWKSCRGKHPLCPDECLNIQDPVCGEDGKIYPNLCLMYKFNCGKKMKTFDLVKCFTIFRGFRHVDTACPKICHELYRPVCGSDGKVYSNDCFLRLQTCGKRNIQIVEMSKCVNTPKCPHTCTPLYDPVCGSNGVLYLNHCYFANLNCGKSVSKVARSFCENRQQYK